jgi:hypothetical protein
MTGEAKYSDASALDKIAEILSSRAWSDASVAEDIEEIVGKTGRKVATVSEQEELDDMIVEAAIILRDAAVSMATWWDALYDLEAILGGIPVEGEELVTIMAGAIEVPVEVPDTDDFVEAVRRLIDEARNEELEDELKGDAEPIDWSEPEMPLLMPSSMS